MFLAIELILSFGASPLANTVTLQSATLNVSAVIVKGFALTVKISIMSRAIFLSEPELGC